MPPEKEPLTPGGKEPEVIEADVATLELVKVIDGKELLTHTVSDKDDAVTVQKQGSIVTKAVVENKGHVAVAATSYVTVYVSGKLPKPVIAPVVELIIKPGGLDEYTPPEVKAFSVG